MPESLEDIARLLWPYSTVLFRISIREGQRPTAQHIGSGTYVKIGQIHGILTAEHCAAALKGDRLGISAAREGAENAPIVERSDIQILDVGVPVTEEYGPDIALIILTNSDNVATIRATNTFFNLEHDRERMLSDPPPHAGSVWYFCGVPNARMCETTSEVGFDQLLEFQLFCGAGGVDRYYERKGFDYFETDVDPNSSLPTTFEGMSGGGLWQVPVTVVEPGSYERLDHFLAGVIFYQSPLKEGRRFLRSHGPKSIYGRVFAKLGLT